MRACVMKVFAPGEHFLDATQIIDLHHAKEHVSDLCKILFRPDEKQVQKYMPQQLTQAIIGRLRRDANAGGSADLSAATQSGVSPTL